MQLEKNAIIEKNETNFNPIEWVIKQFGSGYKLAKDLDLGPCGLSKVSQWKKITDDEGQAGQIPRRHHKKILNLARRFGLDITADDIIRGRQIEE